MFVKKALGKIEALDFSNYILKNYGPMSHLKLQKLLFYCEAYHLAYFDESLIDVDFEAWVHGPVCREIYNHVKGASVLYADVAYAGDDTPDRTFETNLVSEQKDFLKEVLSNLSGWTGQELEATTHIEKPWMEARKGYSPADKCDVKISKETMRIYYKAELNGEVQ